MTIRTHMHEPLFTTVERVSRLPINGAAQVVFSVYAPDVVPAQLVCVKGQFEVTNPYQFNVGIGFKIIRAASASAVDGVNVRPANMENVTPAGHHLVVDTWADDWAAPAGGYYYNVVAWAVASGASGSIIVEPGYGRESVTRWTRITE